MEHHFKNKNKNKKNSRFRPHLIQVYIWTQIQTWTFGADTDNVHSKYVCVCVHMGLCIVAWGRQWLHLSIELYTDFILWSCWESLRSKSMKGNRDPGTSCCSSCSKTVWSEVEWWLLLASSKLETAWCTVGEPGFPVNQLLIRYAMFNRRFSFMTPNRPSLSLYWTFAELHIICIT